MADFGFPPVVLRARTCRRAADRSSPAIRPRRRVRRRGDRRIGPRAVAGRREARAAPAAPGRRHDRLERGVAAGLLAVGLAGLGFDYFFTEPLYTFDVRPSDRPLFFVFLVFALVIASFGERRRRIEHSLREARSVLEREVTVRTQQASLLDLTHDTIFVRDMNDVITYWNRGAEELLGPPGRRSASTRTNSCGRCFLSRSTRSGPSCSAATAGKASSRRPGPMGRRWRWRAAGRCGGTRPSSRLPFSRRTTTSRTAVGGSRRSAPSTAIWLGAPSSCRARTRSWKRSPTRSPTICERRCATWPAMPSCSRRTPPPSSTTRADAS